MLNEEINKSMTDTFDLHIDEEKFVNNIDKNFSIIKPYKDLKAIIEFSSSVYGFNINSSKALIYLIRKNNHDLRVSVM